MPITTVDAILSQPYDCLLLVHPSTTILESKANEIQKHGISQLNICKELSKSLINVSISERSRVSQRWIMERLTAFQRGPILCVYPDLLFDPSLKIDPFILFRQAARFTKIIVLWPGEYLSGTLTYAIPEHHHYQTWKITTSLLQNPVVKIQSISNDQGV